jgi:hypothetical protein
VKTGGRGRALAGDEIAHQDGVSGVHGDAPVRANSRARG